MKPYKLLVCALLMALFTTLHASAQHGHLDAGAHDIDNNGMNLGDPLVFHNWDDFAAPYALELKYNLSTSRYSDAGYGFDGNLTFTAIGQGNVNYVPPLPGSIIMVKLLSVVGPAGAKFSFWEPGEITPLHEVATGTTGAAYMWNLTELTDPPTGETYGHVHGRRFAVDQLGLYTLELVLVDAAGNHADSQPYLFQLNAVPEPGSAALCLLALGSFLVSHRRSRR